MQLEQDVLKKASELIKKDLGIDQRLLTNREKTQLVDALTHAYTLRDLLAEVGLARSSYFYHRAKLGVADKYAPVRRAMAEIFERELDGWHTDDTAWPKRRTLATFKQWFTIEMHSMVEDLCSDELLDDDV